MLRQTMSPAARDQGNGGISAANVVGAIRFLRGKLSPQDHDEFVEMLHAHLNGGEGEGQDQPPATIGGAPIRNQNPLDFGQDRPPHPNVAKGLVGDEKQRRDAAKEFGLDRIGHCPPYGEAVPQTRKQREARLALDAKREAEGGGGYLGGDKQLDADIRRILK